MALGKEFVSPTNTKKTFSLPNRRFSKKNCQPDNIGGCRLMLLGALSAAEDFPVRTLLQPRFDENSVCSDGSEMN